MAEQSQVLYLATGQSVFSVQNQTSIPLHLERLRDNSAVVLDQPVSIVYDDPKYRFQTPSSRFVMVQQAAGVITGIDTSPQLRFLELSTANELAISLQERIRSAGWDLVTSYPMDIRELERLVADPNRIGRFEKDYAEFRGGDAELRIYLREAIGLGLEGRQPPARGNLFLVNVDVTNNKIEGVANERLYSKRRQVNGTVDKSLPLSIWSTISRREP